MLSERREQQEGNLYRRQDMIYSVKLLKNSELENMSVIYFNLLIMKTKFQ